MVVGAGGERFAQCSQFHMVAPLDMTTLLFTTFAQFYFSSSDTLFFHFNQFFQLIK